MPPHEATIIDIIPPAEAPHENSPENPHPHPPGERSKKRKRSKKRNRRENLRNPQHVMPAVTIILALAAVLFNLAANARTYIQPPTESLVDCACSHGPCRCVPLIYYFSLIATFGLVLLFWGLLVVHQRRRVKHFMGFQYLEDSNFSNPFSST
ncbi:unnamed protein product [Prunus armeniaca]